MLQLLAILLTAAPAAPLGLTWEQTPERVRPELERAGLRFKTEEASGKGSDQVWRGDYLGHDAAVHALFTDGHLAGVQVAFVASAVAASRRLYQAVEALTRTLGPPTSGSLPRVRPSSGPEDDPYFDLDRAARHESWSPLVVWDAPGLFVMAALDLGPDTGPDRALVATVVFASPRLHAVATRP